MFLDVVLVVDAWLLDLDIEGLKSYVRVSGTGKTACRLRTMLRLTSSGTLRVDLLMVMCRIVPAVVVSTG